MLQQFVSKLCVLCLEGGIIKSINSGSTAPLPPWLQHHFQCAVIIYSTCQLQLIRQCQSAASPAKDASQSVPSPTVNLHC